MKKLLVVAFIGVLTLTQTSRAAVPLLSGLYNSVSNQLSIVSNTVPVDAKLAKSLTGALSAIQKSGGGTNAATAVKGLGSVVKIVNRTSVSNAVAASVNSTLVSIANQYVGTANTLSNQVANLFPSTAQTAVFNGTSNLIASVNSINSNPDINAALKALTGLAKQVTAIQKNVAAAQKVPSPAASLTATVVISGSPTFNFKAQGLTAQQFSSGNFGINAAQTVVAGFNTALHSIAFGFNGLTPGFNNVVISQGEYSKASSDPTAGAFPSMSGTVQVTWDPAHKLLSGNFACNVSEQGGSRTGSVTGTFSVFYP